MTNEEPTAGQYRLEGPVHCQASGNVVRRGELFVPTARELKNTRLMRRSVRVGDAPPAEAGGAGAPEPTAEAEVTGTQEPEGAGEAKAEKELAPEGLFASATALKLAREAELTAQEMEGQIGTASGGKFKAADVRDAIEQLRP